MTSSRYHTDASVFQADTVHLLSLLSGTADNTVGNHATKLGRRSLSVQYDYITVLPEGFGSISSTTPSQAVAVILRLLYKDQLIPAKPVNDKPPLKAERNQEIVRRYLAGECAVDLAEEFGISVRRVNRLIRHYLDRDRGQE